MEKKSKDSALLIMDMQAGILGNYPHTKETIAKIAKVLSHARSMDIPVIYVVLQFRQGAPEISMNNKIFSAVKNSVISTNIEDWVKIDAAIAPKPGEIIVTKRRVSAFTGSDLELILRTKAIQHIVLTGVATSGVVLSTLREAADKDYNITVLSDCCADRDEEVHRVLTTKVFPRQAEVITSDEWIFLSNKF
ncbi:MAG: cysteine hydrolase [Sporocytophaga sp.]|uniref:cysteine hydrolase family protein n=1 Tax=Sporocytophaga sp. TaxID=2231183 RepID=UPI001AFDF8C7|nr:isochorismatase family cysteine hydrolase [Sporocytophaga sp.]MBO9703115.1 cysteine hydrolase [Sporocytophaga sp.]